MPSFGMIIMAALYILAGANHFRKPDFYLPMMPPWIPQHKLMIALSGVAEIGLGLMLFFEPTRSIAGIGIIDMLLIFFSVHIYMWQVRKTVFAKIPVAVLLLRFPLQLVLIYWAWLYI